MSLTLRQWMMEDVVVKMESVQTLGNFTKCVSLNWNESFNKFQAIPDLFVII